MQPQEIHWLETQPLTVVYPAAPPLPPFTQPAPKKTPPGRLRAARWLSLRMTRQGLAAGLALLAVWGLKAANLPLTQPVLQTLQQTLTYDADLNGALGQLYFVQNLNPTLSQQQLPALGLAAPASGRVVQGGGEAVGILCMEDAYARASLAGVVQSVQPAEGGGFAVVLRHINGITTRYAPLEAALVTVGADIQKNAPLGVVRAGSSGRVLSFSLHQNGQALDPLPALVPKAGE